MDFTYHMPTRVLFGRGKLDNLGSVLEELHAKRVLVVTGRGSMRKTGMLDRVLGLMGGLDVTVFDDVEADPSVKTIDEGVRVCNGADLIVALGGGSPIDAAKAISAVIGNGGSAAEYMGARKALLPGPPIVAIPTTAGTASEITEVSVLSDREMRTKRSFRSRHMYPVVAIDDPDLTRTMPKEVTASTGLDALTHAIEAYTSKKSQPITDVVCMQAAKLALENLPNAFEDGNDMQARNNMMLASLMAGFGITHAGAGAAHGLAYGLWNVKDTPHGMACGIVLPHVMRFNLGHDGGKYAALARYCGYKNQEDLIGRVEALNEELGVPKRLHSLGISKRDIPSMMEMSLGGSTKVNPREISHEDMVKLIESII